MVPHWKSKAPVAIRSLLVNLAVLFRLVVHLGLLGSSNPGGLGWTYYSITRPWVDVLLDYIDHTPRSRINQHRPIIHDGVTITPRDMIVGGYIIISNPALG